MTKSTPEERLLAALDEDQANAAQIIRGPVCIIAGAGSGKTRTVSHRIALGIERGAYTANRVLALTYTNRAAAELRTRLRSLGAGGVQVRTFHSAALGQLQFFWPQLTGTSAPKLVTNKSGLIKDVLAAKRLSLTANQVRDLAAEIDWCKYSMVSPKQYLALERKSVAGLDGSIFLEIASEYENLKQSKKSMDWEDVLVLTIGLLRSEARMLEHVQQQYRFFTVDEYQDISPLQQALLETWLGDREDLCVVGDPRQTIYSFSGASQSFLMGFESRFERAQVVELNRNYRSTPEIVALANKVANHADLIPNRISSGAPEFIPVKSDVAEVSLICEGVLAALKSGIDAREIAVLVRINSQIAAIELALQAESIPVQVRGAGRFFRRPEVLHAMAAINALQVSEISNPLFIEVSNILTALGWASARQSDEKWAGLNWFIEVLEEMGASTSLDEYLRELEERERSGHEPVSEAVTLATIHSTKGLEWEYVHLAGLNQGLFPISYAQTEAEIAEEKRLFYVGLTRAKNTLKISWNQQKARSEFLDHLAG
jgi:DNA helicase II / ATP-dependent DNA helicase PcrA